MLVTGSAGFVGRVFLKALYESLRPGKDNKLFLVQKVSQVPKELVSQLASVSEVQIVNADLTEPWTFKFEVDQIVNLAADGTNDPYSELSNQRYIQINRNLIAWLRRFPVSRMVHVSSGICDYLDANPSSPIILQPGKTKFAKARRLVESALQDFCIEESIECKILRLYTFIGSELANIHHYAVNQFIYSAKNQGIIKVMGNSKTRRSYLLDRDLGEVIIKAVSDLNIPKRVSVASRYPVMMRELAEIVSREIPSRVEFLGEHLPIEDYLPIHAKTIFPETPNVTEGLSDTIRRMIVEKLKK